MFPSPHLYVSFTASVHTHKTNTHTYRNAHKQKYRDDSTSVEPMRALCPCHMCPCHMCPCQTARQSVCMSMCKCVRVYSCVYMCLRICVSVCQCCYLDACVYVCASVAVSTCKCCLHVQMFLSLHAVLDVCACVSLGICLSQQMPLYL